MAEREIRALELRTLGFMLENADECSPVSFEDVGTTLQRISQRLEVASKLDARVRAVRELDRLKMVKRGEEAQRRKKAAAELVAQQKKGAN